MTPVLHIFNPFAAAAAGALLASIWKGLVLAAGVAVVLRWVPGISAATRSLIWTAVLLTVLLLPALPMSAGHVVASGSGGLFHVNEIWGVALAALWAAASLFRAGQLIVSAIRLRTISKRAVPVTPSAEIAAHLISAGRKVELCASTDVNRPSVTGFLKPRILVPAGLLEKISATELEQIVLHEMEHLRRHDDWTNLLQKVSLTLFPLNPVLMWLDHRLSLERELACDESVVHVTRARKAYATCLVTLAGDSMARRGVSLALGAWERKSELTRRVHHILRQPEKIMTRMQARVVMGVLLAGLTGSTAILERSPRLVSFTPAGPVVQAQAAPAAELPASSPAIKMQPVAMKTEAQPAALLTAVAVKAVMPQPQHRSPLKLVSATQRKQRMTPRQQMVAPWMVLTGWRPDVRPVRMIQTDEDLHFSYAAVRVPDGWLIIQL